MASMTGKKVYIDAGHNGTHTGTTGNNLKEHEVVLDIAKACNAQLIAYGATTGMSRTNHNALSSNYTTDLNLRVERSNTFGANIFVSIHNNAHATTSPNGGETFVRPGASSFTKALAARVNSTVATRTGMAQRPTPVPELAFRVINDDNKACAILVEVGFLSNSGDAGKLNTLAKRNVAGNAITEAIKNHVATLPE